MIGGGGEEAGGGGLGEVGLVVGTGVGLGGFGVESGVVFGVESGVVLGVVPGVGFVVGLGVGLGCGGPVDATAVKCIVTVQTKTSGDEV